jgi:phage baseplate assembly protein gpV
MALTKVTKSGITDNSIDADKIEDGTIVAADIADGTITSAKLTGSIANNKLANSSITVNGTSVSLGGSVSAGSVEWQAVKTAAFNAVAGEGYFVRYNFRCCYSYFTSFTKCW